MFQSLVRTDTARRRHCDAPFAVERARYLRHCADHGATLATLRMKSTELLWAARLLPPMACQGIGMEQLLQMVRQRTSIHKGSTTGQRLIDIARPWLRYLGLWREPIVEVPFQGQLDDYVTWMRDERGFSASTIEQWQGQIRIFLQWWPASTSLGCR